MERTDRTKTRQTRGEKSRTKKPRDFFVFVFSLHARKKMRKAVVMKANYVGSRWVEKSAREERAMPVTLG